MDYSLPMGTPSYQQYNQLMDLIWQCLFIYFFMGHQDDCISSLQNGNVSLTY